MSTSVRERENDDPDFERDSKRPKIEANPGGGEEEENPEQAEQVEEKPHILPPSHSLLGIALPAVEEGRAVNFLEGDVGISEYVGRGVSKIEGIIKQRSVSINRIASKEKSFQFCTDLQIS